MGNRQELLLVLATGSSSILVPTENPAWPLKSPFGGLASPVGAQKPRVQQRSRHDPSMPDLAILIQMFQFVLASRLVPESVEEVAVPTLVAVRDHEHQQRREEL